MKKIVLSILALVAISSVASADVIRDGNAVCKEAIYKDTFKGVFYQELEARIMPSQDDRIRMQYARSQQEQQYNMKMMNRKIVGFHDYTFLKEEGNEVWCSVEMDWQNGNYDNINKKMFVQTSKFVYLYNPYSNIVSFNEELVKSFLEILNQKR